MTHPRTVTLRVRYSPELHAACKAAAAANGRTLSGWVRVTLENEATRVLEAAARAADR